MNDFEQAHLPECYRPLSSWAYFGLQILYSIPLIGFIFLVCHAIGSKNTNKKHFARSYFCVLVLILIVVGILLLTGGAAALASFLSSKTASFA